MKINLYRICGERFVRSLDGKGAEISGGRWNSIGTPMIYTSMAQSTCTLEKLAHTDIDLLPSNLVLITFSLEILDEEPILELSTLPLTWDNLPPTEDTQILGNKFIQDKKGVALRVPSVLSVNDYNVLINPNHLNISKLKIANLEAFSFDPRLLPTSY